MQRKEDTPIRKIRRRYEEEHKEERQAAHKVWGTSIERKSAEEIDVFLKENNLTKLDLIFAGYLALQNQYDQKKTE